MYMKTKKETKGGFSDLDKDNLIYSNSLISVSPAGFVLFVTRKVGSKIPLAAQLPATD